MTGILLSLLGGKVSVVPDPYFEYTTLLLPGNGTNGAQNNTFLDSSTNNFTITRNGNTTQGTFSPFSPSGWSAYFNGSSNIVGPTDTALGFGSNDFTIEMWANIPSTSGTGFFASVWETVGGSDVNSSWLIRLNNNGTLVTNLMQGAGTYNTLTSGQLPTNTWFHIAFTRSGNTQYLFINGSLAQSSAVSGAMNTAIRALRIGTQSGGNALTGYISNLRIINGTCLYASNFVVPTSALSNVPNTKLLTCQSNRVVDNSGNNFSLTPTSVQMIAFSPFNPSASWSAATYGGSGYFDGNGDYLTIPDDASWDLSSSTGSIELFVYPPVAATGTPGLIGQCPTTANWSIYIYSDGRIAVGIQGLSELATAGGSLIVNSMNHIVITRDSGTSRTRLFVNGILKATGTGTYFNNSSASLHIGYFNGYSFNGYISEVRFCKGSIPTTYQTSSITVGDSIFTPPSAPITTSSQGATSGDVKLLLNFTNAGIYDATSRNDLETVGNAQISTTQSKFGGSSMAFDGTGDYLLTNVASADLYTFGTGNFTIEMWVYVNSLPGTDMVIYDGRPSNGAYPCIILQGSTNKIIWYVNTNIQITATSVVPTSTWFHLAISRSGTSTKMFVDGTQSGSTYNDSTNYLGSANRPYIGANATTGTQSFNGYIQDLRVTKGYARYTANFTAPASPFPLL